MSGAAHNHVPEQARRARRRLVVLLLVFSLWLLGVGARLYWLQILRHDHYAERAERQQQRIVKLHGPRGTIYDARGRELAVSVEVESAYAVPSEIDPAAVPGMARALHGPLPTSVAELERLLGSGREFVWLARKLEPWQSQQVRDLGLDGVYFLPESKRYYPFGEVAAQVLGYVGTDNLGLGGLESEYDRVVSGKTATRTVLRDLHGRLLDIELSFADAPSGEDLYLTLDASLQYMAEKELQRAIQETGAEAGTVVLLDARDSAVLAMASAPSFDPNRFTSFPESTWRNSAVMDAFEPGSTFKIITAAAAIENGRLQLDDLFDCEEGGITLDDTFIGDHERFGILTFRDVIAHSSNVGTIKAALRTGDDRFRDMVAAFGFGRPTGIDLPGESAGILRPREQWTHLVTAYGAFGMGLSVTPLQLANAYATVARGGELRQPYIVAAAGRDGELVRPQHGKARARPVSEATATSLLELLREVVVAGTGKTAALRGYAVAGKTGTAEKSDRSGYSDTDRVASFAGLAPFENPRLVCLVVLDRPRTSQYGGEVAAPVFATIVEQALVYLGVAPQPDVQFADGQLGRRLQHLQQRSETLAQLEPGEPETATVQEQKQGDATL